MKMARPLCDTPLVRSLTSNGRYIGYGRMCNNKGEHPTATRENNMQEEGGTPSLELLTKQRKPSTRHMFCPRLCNSPKN